MRRLGLLIWTVVLVLLACVVAPLDPVHATFRGTNGRISFARYVPATDSTEIFSIRADGTDEQQLTFDPSGRSSLFSDWSPDGSRIAIDSDHFSNGTDDVVDIFTMKADGSDVAQLTSHAGFNGEPDYSPDGTKIAFESDRGIGFPLQGIYFMNASDGSDVQRVSFPSDKERDVEPHFSPDGTRVAFTRTRNCPLRDKGCIAAIYVATLGGTGLTRITQWGQDTGGMDWSPDGTKVVYNTGQDRNSSYVDIFVANADGSQPVNLTNNGAFVAKCPVQASRGLSWRAKWSPDSTKFVFDQADCVNGPSLWLMNADGSGKHQLQLTPFPDKSDWGTNQK